MRWWPIRQSTPDITALNHEDAKVVATPDSPSEFLSRVIIAHFHLPDLPRKWLREGDGAEDVFEQLKQADQSTPQAFVLWEPYVAKARQIPGVHVLVDSSSLSGYIVDVLVVQRAFLRDQPDLAKRVVQGYLRAAYQHQQKGMAQLIGDDAKRLGTPLDSDQLTAVIDGISWANTVDNYAYFGLQPASGRGETSGSIRHIRDSITAINDVLLSTDRLKKDPLNGQPETLYYDQILRQLQQEQFHPATAASSTNILSGPVALPQEAVRSQQQLGQLSEQQWGQLRPLGQLQAEPVEFGRGGARLTLQAQRDLRSLAEKLVSWPRSYCDIVGHTRDEGDRDANLALARQRAEAVRSFLIDQGHRGPASVCAPRPNSTVAVKKSASSSARHPTDDRLAADRH